MSTPANIAELSKDGKLRIINVAMDGYPEEGGAGNVLLNAYNNPNKVNQLMKLGNLAHVGFTPKQANAYKEAGADWSQYAVPGSTISGKDYKGNYTSPQEARRNQKKMTEWFQHTDNYTHAFQRDCGRGQSERGVSVNVPGVQSSGPNTVDNAVGAMNRSARFESEHNYLYDDATKQWFYNEPGSSQKEPLADVVPKHDRNVVHHDYEKFEQNPVNPHLPKVDSLKAHDMIDKALHAPITGLQSQLDDDSGALKNNISSATQARKELNSGHVSSARSQTLHQIVFEDANPKSNHRLVESIHREKAQIKNLHSIDKFLVAHPETKLYPNDLRLGSRFSEQVKNHSVSVNRNDFGKFFNEYPEYNKKLDFYSGDQVTQILSHRDITYKKGIADSAISSKLVKPLIRNDEQAMKMVKPDKIYSSAQVQGAEAFGPKTEGVNFKPVSYADFKQNVQAIAPHDVRLQHLLKSQQPAGQKQKAASPTHKAKISKSDMDKYNKLAKNAHAKAKSWNSDVKSTEKGQAKKSKGFQHKIGQSVKKSVSHNRGPQHGPSLG